MFFAKNTQQSNDNQPENKGQKVTRKMGEQPKHPDSHATPMDPVSRDGDSKFSDEIIISKID